MPSLHQYRHCSLFSLWWLSNLSSAHTFKSVGQSQTRQRMMMTRSARSAIWKCRAIRPSVFHDVTILVNFLALGCVATLSLIRSCSGRGGGVRPSSLSVSVVVGRHYCNHTRHNQLHLVSAVKPFAKVWLLFTIMVMVQVVTASITALFTLGRIFRGSVLRHQLLSLLPSPFFLLSGHHHWYVNIANIIESISDGSQGWRSMVSPNQHRHEVSVERRWRGFHHALTRHFIILYHGALS